MESTGDALSTGSREPSSPENEGHEAQGETHENAVSGPQPTSSGLGVEGTDREQSENSEDVIPDTDSALGSSLKE
jgi:hypothetical protein